MYKELGGHELYMRRRIENGSTTTTSFSHISINSSTILMVLMAIGSPQKDLLINTSHVLRQSILVEILGRSTGNHHGTIY